MSDLLREAPLGQLIRFVTRGRYLKYPEERADFVLPMQYTDGFDWKVQQTPAGSQLKLPSSASSSKSEKDIEAPQVPPTGNAIGPTRTADGTILVDWYGPDDPSNPLNWSLGKRNFVTAIICVYTFVVYCASAIYVPSESGVAEHFNVNRVQAALPLALYVLAYGAGPLLFAPLSEVPSIGRSPVYAVTMVLFTILSVPTALVDNFSGLLALRFLQGFFGSPCLANGAASVQDLYDMLYVPYGLTAWVFAAYGGPALGPLLAGFAVDAKGWRWSLWEILWMAGPVVLVMLACLPETLAENILHRRAARLRKLTGNEKLQAQSEIDQRHMTASSIVMEALIRPVEIVVKDPAIGFVNIYTALVYGIYYSFFEAFPIVYLETYGFSLGFTGLVFVVVEVGAIAGAVVYVAYMYWIVVPEYQKNGWKAQEHRLLPAVFAAFGPPIGLFLFAWTARSDIHVSRSSPWLNNTTDSF
jgi:DHA1 family multidrug resistance protein-like MFS transporter